MKKFLKWSMVAFISFPGSFAVPGALIASAFAEESGMTPAQIKACLTAGECGQPVTLHDHQMVMEMPKKRVATKGWVVSPKETTPVTTAPKPDPRKVDFEAVRREIDAKVDADLAAIAASRGIEHATSPVAQH